ncbi:serine aminopeptidase domain-containing protein [Paraburkholderia sp. RL17-337-BIB-A]|uniref:serine aminopeptidase domain-containing protein n=1 Tax=Paraburkholderia sp. RL17-337-BIB-A TaxID=3031636 RepID=UPI0038B74382
MTSNPTTTPVTFDGCLGWLHQPASSQAKIGAVLCSPFGYEALCAYRGWRELADSLAAGAGIPALRFDYPGTGDSKGNQEDPQIFRAWIDSIKAAAAYLRATTGVERLIFCGVRLGATLAAIAAEEMGGVDTLVMIAPVITGKRYVRELAMQHKSWLSTADGLRVAHSNDDGPAVGAYGFQLFPDTLEQLTAVDLEKQAGHVARRLLLHDTFDNAHTNRLLESYRRQGVEADLQIFPEYDKLLVDSWYSQPPREAFNTVLTWLGWPPGTQAQPAPDTVAPAAGARIDFAAGYETPVVFGGARYVGVFCRPRRPLQGAPAVLFVNTGGVHRIGEGRVAVLMARRLAAQGIASLRMDLGGLGDSQRRDDSLTLGAVYARHGVTDAKVGVDWLLKAGHPKVVMFGVCSGAYVSIHTALAHPGVVGCMSVNMPFFIWRRSLMRPGARSVESSLVYWRAIRDLRKWTRLLTGQVNGMAIFLELARRRCARVLARASGPFERCIGFATSTGAIRRIMTGLEHKGVQTSLIYGSLDAGLEELTIHFGPNGSELGVLTNVTTKVLERVDHALFSRSAREAVINQFEQFLHERILDTEEVSELCAAVLRTSSP